ncbi:MAG: hypothetical protein FWF20_08365 [Betaproteobacteria bacterium]|nr:hypothetical protein [Betaproteobacteria bacterium]MCL2886778.1 hypothetical protein [Betaproteobacteria bacterium]
MLTQVHLSELLEALDWVSASGPFESVAYVSRESGRIYYHTDANDFGEALPDDVEDENLYVSVPRKRDLGLGQRLVLDFIGANAPDAYDQVRHFFHKRGAYARYKDLLDRRGLLGAWFAHEQQACEAAMREWAESEGFEVITE